MHTVESYILSLIAAKLCGEKLTEREEKDLQQWLDSKAENRKIYSSYRHLFDRREQLGVWEKIDSPQEMYKKMICFHRKPLHRFVRITKYAAVILLAAFLSVWAFRQKPTEKEPMKMVEVPVRDIAPGKQKARLELGNGEVIALSDSNMMLRSHKDIKVQNGGVLQYAANEGKEEVKAVYHTLTVERGGEFQLILPDGTKVWLNSESELKYPNIFNENTRKVYLKGEAYFEVKHSDKQPFVVTAGECKIQVFGTEFNIASYEGEEQILTTLVNGKVGYAAGKDKGELKPGQQCVYDRQRKSASVKEVDVTQYISWKNGLFTFDHIRMDDLARQIARWYNVKTEFINDAVRHISFTGAMERYRPVSYIIQLLNETNTVDCRLEEGVLKFYQK